MVATRWLSSDFLVPTLHNTPAQQDHYNHGRDVGRCRRILSPANFVGVRTHEEPSVWDEAEVVEVVSLQRRTLTKTTHTMNIYFQVLRDSRCKTVLR